MNSDSVGSPAPRFAFGRNWHAFVRRHFSPERLKVAQQRLLGFTGLQSLAGIRFLDIGCGSGIHSYAALNANAAFVHGFDYDAESVAATRLLQKHAGVPHNWVVERGDVLDGQYIAGLGKWTFVYSWGVLHHTGSMWQAIRNAQSCVEDGGLFYIALYSADADFQPSKEFWLDVKQRYNKSGPLRKQLWVWWYIWRFGMGSSIRKLPNVVTQILTYRIKRGMNYFADVRDWLGGWPMEYAPDQAVVDLLEGEYGFTLVNIATGEACSEFLFRRDGGPHTRTLAKDFAAQCKLRHSTDTPTPT